MTAQIWANPAIMEWSQLLLNSFRHWTGRELLERVGDRAYQAHALFLSPIVVISHGMEEDPLLNYGNQVALELWEMSWEDLRGRFSNGSNRGTCLPSITTSSSNIAVGLIHNPRSP
jgi:hypothetical protein